MQLSDFRLGTSAFLLESIRDDVCSQRLNPGKLGFGSGLIGPMFGLTYMECGDGIWNVGMEYGTSVSF